MMKVKKSRYNYNPSGMCCDHCGTWINHCFTFEFDNGTTYTVGSTCVEKIIKVKKDLFKKLVAKHQKSMAERRKEVEFYKSATTEEIFNKSPMKFMKYKNGTFGEMIPMTAEEIEQERNRWIWILEERNKREAEELANRVVGIESRETFAPTIDPLDYLEQSTDSIQRW